MRTTRPIAATAAGLALLTPALVGCTGTPTPPEPVTIGDVVLTPDAVVLVAGATQNVPAPRLDGRVGDLIGWALSTDVPVEVVLVSAAPEPLDTDDLALLELGGTTSGNARVVERNLERIEERLSYGPSNDGADYLEALVTAYDVAISRDAVAPTLVVVGSGLSDTGAMDLTAPGMLGADGAEVTDQLLGSGAIRADRLEGATVVLSGFGWTTPPQDPLRDDLRLVVASQYAAVAEGMGAVALIDPAPRTGHSVPTPHTVRPVAIGSTPPATDPCVPAEIVFDNQSAVSFVARTTTFVDPPGAHQALSDVADWLLTNPGARAEIRGTTADDGSEPEVLREFGRLRAQVVADYLVGRGVDPTALSVQGVGSNFPEYVRPDRDALGNLLPGPATLNRSVRIRLTATC